MGCFRRIISVLLLMSASTGILSYSRTASSPSAYEILQQFELPVGLLPEGITGYDLDHTTGHFSARLKGTCSFELQDKYTIQYEPIIEGAIKSGIIEDLKGVRVKVLGMVWLRVVRVVKEGSNIEFSVGLVSAEFPVESFKECPRCGCGLDCGDVEAM